MGVAPDLLAVASHDVTCQFPMVVTKEHPRHLAAVDHELAVELGLMQLQLRCEREDRITRGQGGDVSHRIASGVSKSLQSFASSGTSHFGNSLPRRHAMMTFTMSWQISLAAFASLSAAASMVRNQSLPFGEQIFALVMRLGGGNPWTDARQYLPPFDPFLGEVPKAALTLHQVHLLHSLEPRLSDDLSKFVGHYHCLTSRAARHALR